MPNAPAGAALTRASTLYTTAAAIPASVWPWPNFRPAEIACKGSGSLLLVPAALDALQALRTRLGRPLVIVSGYRSPAYNRRVGGAPKSKHMDGTAFDIACVQADQPALIAAAKAVGFLGIGRYDTWVHVDLGPARSWDERTREA